MKMLRPTCGPGTLVELRNQWRNLTSRARTMKLQKFKQVMKTIDIYQRWSSCVKKASDPAQERAHSNPQHLKSVLRHYATTLCVRPTKKKKRARWAGDHLFRHGLLPLVPFDASLRLFIRTLWKYPFLNAHITGARGDNPLFDAFNLLDINSKDVEIDDAAKLYTVYPPHIVKDIHTAIKGMAYVYTLPDVKTGHRATVLRTKYTPWSAEPFRMPEPRTYYLSRAALVVKNRPSLHKKAPSPWAAFPSNEPPELLLGTKTPRNEQHTRKKSTCPSRHTSEPQEVLVPSLTPTIWDFSGEQPIFLSPPYPHLVDVNPRKIHASAVSSRAVTLRNQYHEKEFEWLEAYLRACRFMEGLD